MPDLLAPENIAFAVALALLGLLVIVQALGLGHFLHLDLDAPDAPDLDVADGLASIAGLGKLPFVVWLSTLLASFALLGLGIQNLAEGLTGAPIAALPASGLALVAALPVNAVVAALLARVWPRDETTAVGIETLVGRRGTVTLGTSARGHPARIAVRDVHGQIHHVMAEPHEDGTSFAAGDEVMLVRREGELFYAIDGQGPIRLTI